MLCDRDYLLVDSTGSRTKTRLEDMDDRKSYNITPAQRGHQRTVHFYRSHDPRYVQGVLMSSAVLCLSDNEPTTIWMEGWTEPIALETFLPKASIYNNVMSRRFIASDGQMYAWSRKLKEEHEWSCTNKRNYSVAYYSLPSENQSQSCMVVDATFIHLDIELIATLFAMRFLHE